ncbi:MAG: putative thiol:disulfide interchange protein DsbD [Chthoniobacteraceae bacterium]|nr:putative thiol:disulfide interchange protein DsbD [Chthoniobacteraceae bacterium]
MKLSIPLFCILIGWAVSAVSNAGDNPLNVQLVAENVAIQPGHAFRVGLHLQHPAGYHSYWKFAGIVGIPTGIEWKLPPGWTAGEIEWPAPERVLMFQIKAQGFYDEKLLPIMLTPPKDLVPGRTVKLEGTARWMCCGRNCNPGFKNVSVELPVQADAPAPDSRWSELFEKSLSSGAKYSNDWTARAEITNQNVIFHILPVSAAAREQMSRIRDVKFFTEDGLTDPNRPESLTRSETELLFTQGVSEFAPDPLPKEVRGILQSAEGWLPGESSIRISAPLHR